MVYVSSTPGDTFPLDGGNATAGKTVTYRPNGRFTLRCPAGVEPSLTTKATFIWSSGAPHARNTTVIGKLILPERHKTMSDLGGNRCFDISFEGSLLLTNCSQDDDVRYWCHVFPEGDVLRRSYVDVIAKSEYTFSSSLLCCNVMPLWYEWPAYHFKPCSSNVIMRFSFLIFRLQYTYLANKEQVSIELQ